MFDRLDWFEILLLLAPVALIMTWIKRREIRQNGVDFKQLNPRQKIWLFITLMPPGLAASLLSKMSSDQRDMLLSEGKAIRGRADTAALPLLVEFIRHLGEEKRVKAKEVGEVLDFLEARFHSASGELLQSIKNCWNLK